MGHSWETILLAAMLLAGCSAADDGGGTESPDDKDKQQAITLHADIWKVMAATRATTFDNAAALQTQSFRCYVYNEDTTTPYINGATVSYAGSEWSFDDGKYYWPLTGSLDFFAYLPATPPSYVTGVSYAVDNPSFSCIGLPLTDSGQSELSEFIYALTPGQSKAGQGETGVTLTFQHPFARILFRMSGATTTATINSISIAGVKNSGSYTHSAGWTGQSGSGDFTTGGIDADTPYIVLPQTFAGSTQTITVTATWGEWSGSATKTMSTNVAMTQWEPGYSYTYTFTLKEDGIIVETEKFTEQW